jgi:D-alanyl-D-alanine carboxypeptidase
MHAFPSFHRPSFPSFVGAVAALSFASVAAAELAPARTADGRLDRALRELVEMDFGPVGAISIIQRDGRWSVHRAGEKELDTRRPIGWRDHMRVASVAKAYSGAVALALVDRGVLSLDDTIGERLPDLPDDWSAVTLREMLSHTSGLPDYTQDEDFADEVREDPLRYFAPDELLPYVYEEELEFTPGEFYLYSNSDNVAVALMAEAATGEAYDDLLQRYVYDRIRVRDTSLPITAELPFPLIHGYFYEDTGPLDVSEAINPSGAWASGGIVSTPADLNKFIRGLLGRRYFGRRAQMEQLDFFPGAESDPPGPGENSAGLGIFRYETECGVVYGHTGSFPGYTQFAAASRDGSRSATVSVNLQVTPVSDPIVFEQLRRTFELAVCAALAPVRTGAGGTGGTGGLG